MIIFNLFNKNYIIREIINIISPIEKNGIIKVRYCLNIYIIKDKLSITHPDSIDNSNYWLLVIFHLQSMGLAIIARSHQCLKMQSRWFRRLRPNWVRGLGLKHLDELYVMLYVHCFGWLSSIAEKELYNSSQIIPCLAFNKLLSKYFGGSFSRPRCTKSARLFCGVTAILILRVGFWITPLDTCVLCSNCYICSTTRLFLSDPHWEFIKFPFE